MARKAKFNLFLIWTYFKSRWSGRTSIVSKIVNYHVRNFTNLMWREHLLKKSCFWLKSKNEMNCQIVMTVDWYIVIVYCVHNCCILPLWFLYVRKQSGIDAVRGVRALTINPLGPQRERDCERERGWPPIESHSSCN